MDMQKLLPLVPKAPQMNGEEFERLRIFIEFFPKALDLPQEDFKWLRNYARRCGDVRKCPQNNFGKMALFLRAGMDPNVDEVVMEGAMSNKPRRSILQVCLQRGLTAQAEDLLYAGAFHFGGYNLRSLFSCASGSDQLVSLFEYGANPGPSAGTIVERCLADFLVPDNTTNHYTLSTANAIIGYARPCMQASFHGKAIVVRQLFDTCIAFQSMFLPVLLLIEIAEWAASMRQHYKSSLPRHSEWAIASTIRNSADIEWAE